MRRLVGLLPVVALAACGGGGGGGGGASPVGFTSFDDLQPNSIVQLPAGNARQGIVRFDDAGENVVALGPFPAVDAAVVVQLDAQAELAAIQLRAGGRTIALDLDDPDTFGGELAGDPRFVVLERLTDTTFDGLVLADPEAFGFNYMLFGEWAQLNAFTPQVLLGWGAFGARTEAASMPTNGTATYSGASIGAAFAADGDVQDVGANVALNADFAANTLGFTTTGTRDLATGAALGGLNMQGALAIDGAGFGGTATTTSGWSGPVDGSFYGPAAEEAGGVFDVVGPAGFQRYTGSFGARR